jgi:hypothetical protein
MTGGLAESLNTTRDKLIFRRQKSTNFHYIMMLRGHLAIAAARARPILRQGRMCRSRIAIRRTKRLVSWAVTRNMRQAVERLYGRVKKRLSIIGTTYCEDPSSLPQLWVVAIWLIHLHVTKHPFAAAGDGRDDCPHEEPQQLEAPSDPLSPSGEPPHDADAQEVSGHDD